MNTMLEYLYAGQELYSALLGPLRTRYQLTTTELLVLLCLANDPQHDTARDIVETLRIAKSHVSVSVRALEKRGYIEGAYQGCNRRTIHLRLCKPAMEIIAVARQAQGQFLAILEQDFSDEERTRFRQYLHRMNNNIHTYLNECSMPAMPD